MEAKKGKFRMLEPRPCGEDALSIRQLHTCFVCLRGVLTPTSSEKCPPLIGLFFPQVIISDIIFLKLFNSPKQVKNKQQKGRAILCVLWYGKSTCLPPILGNLSARRLAGLFWQAFSSLPRGKPPPL